MNFIDKAKNIGNTTPTTRTYLFYNLRKFYSYEMYIEWKYITNFHDHFILAPCFTCFVYIYLLLSMFVDCLKKKKLKNLQSKNLRKFY